MISDSVEVCETEVSFLHIQLIGTNAWLPKMHNVPPDVDILSPQDLLQNRSLETVPICTVLQCFPHDNIVCNYMYDECKRSNEITVCHKLWSIL